MMERRLLAGACVLILSLPQVAMAGDLSSLARDLERALGRGSVEVSRRTTGRPAGAVRRAGDEQSGINALVEAMNHQRAAYGLPALRLNEQLSQAAQDRVADMFEQRYFNHVAPDGTQPWSWVRKRGYRYRSVGENLAVGYGTAHRVVGGWMNSPGHRANILGATFDEVGLAVAEGAPIRGYAGPTIVAIYASR